VSDFLETIPEQLRGSIHTFCTDMWEGYINALTDFIAKYKLKRLKEELPEKTFQRDCQGALWLLRHNHDALDEEQQMQLRRLLAHSSPLHEAYTLRTELTAIFDLDLSREQGETRLLKWIAKVERSTLTCFNKATKTLHNHLSLIANYFIRRANSGFVEGFNNKLKVIKRRCYGIKKVDSLFQRLWLDTMGYAQFA
jgi:transposase